MQRSRSGEVLLEILPADEDLPRSRRASMSAGSGVDERKIGALFLIGLGEEGTGRSQGSRYPPRTFDISCGAEREMAKVELRKKREETPLSGERPGGSTSRRPAQKRFGPKGAESNHTGRVHTVMEIVADSYHINGRRE